MNIKGKIEYVIIVLDKGANSFCYYNHKATDSELMPLNTLKKSIEFCKANKLFANILYGDTKLPKSYLKELNSFPHIKLLDGEANKTVNTNDVFILDFNTNPNCFEIEYTSERKNVIVRLQLADVSKLVAILPIYYQKFKRINFIFSDIESATENILNKFRLDLQNLQRFLFQTILKKKDIEISFATDRIKLDAMNNCDAGVKHFTIAPNGFAYICPGFYYDNPDNNIGSINNGIEIDNQQLLNIDHAPICINCDCYQCKRCVYLNQKTTNEANTPSHQQCVISHHERNLSGFLLEKLHKREVNKNIKKIPAIYHLDPIELIIE